MEKNWRTLEISFERWDQGTSNDLETTMIGRELTENDVRQAEGSQECGVETEEKEKTSEREK